MKVKLFLILISIVIISYCSPLREKTSSPRTEPGETSEREIVEGEIYQEGIASWYGPDFHGKRTANTEIYDQMKLTAAHQELPFDTLVEVHNLDNGKKVTVRINDRGPFVKGRIIDLSRKAAQRLDMVGSGTAAVSLRIVKASDVEMATPGSGDEETTVAAAPPTPEAKTFEKEVIQENDLEDINKSVPDEPMVRDQPVAQQEEPPVTQVEDLPQTQKIDTPRQWGDFFLQAGAFSSYQNAGRMVSHIKDVVPGIPFTVKYLDGFYKAISSRCYATREEAEKDRQVLQDNGFDTLIKKQ